MALCDVNLRIFIRKVVLTAGHPELGEPLMLLERILRNDLPDSLVEELSGESPAPGGALRGGSSEPQRSPHVRQSFLTGSAGPLKGTNRLFGDPRCLEIGLLRYDEGSE